MRSALWILLLCASAVAAALFLSNNRATVTLFWHPYRVDMSLNLLLLILASTAVLLALIAWALTSVWRMPTEAKVWRQHRHEVAAHHALVQGLAHFSRGEWAEAIEAATQARGLISTAYADPHLPGAGDEDEARRLVEMCDWLQRTAQSRQPPIRQSRDDQTG